MKHVTLRGCFVLLLVLMLLLVGLVYASSVQGQPDLNLSRDIIFSKEYNDKLNEYGGIVANLITGIVNEAMVRQGVPKTG